jgi:hypothetical protein
VGDFDVLKKDEFSTGYVPTILLVEDGQIKEKYAGNDYTSAPLPSSAGRQP